MVDRLDIERRSRLMKRVGTRDTGPEIAVRALLHRLGDRFRLHRRDLPGTPDIVLPRWRTVIFVHGCFWHAHGCKKGRLPKSRHDYWVPKLAANVARDTRIIEELTNCGWEVLVVWACELSDPQKLIERFHRHMPPS